MAKAATKKADAKAKAPEKKLPAKKVRVRQQVKKGTHGGDWLSSIWRGGSPTHRRVTGSGDSGACAARVVVVVVGGGGPPPPGPSPSTPSPSPNSLFCASGAFLICWTACGARAATTRGSRSTRTGADS